MSSIYKRTLKNGSVRYEAHTVVQEPGGRRRATNRRFKLRKDAQDWLSHLNVAVSDGVFRELTKGTFAEYAEHWKKTYLDDYKPNTIRSYLGMLDTHLIPAFRYYPIAAISPAEINRMKADLHRSGKSAGTIRNILSFLSKIMKRAITDGYIRHSPLEGVEKPSPSKKQAGKAIPPEDIRRLETLAKGMIRLLFLAAVLTGLRRSELFGLGWEHIDWEADVIHVRRALYQHRGKWREERGGEAFEFIDPKTEKSRRDVDLSPRLKKELQLLWIAQGRPAEGLVFHRPDGRPCDAGNETRYFTRLQEIAGLGRYEEVKKLKKNGEEKIHRIFRREYRWHDLRHTFGSLKLAQHEDIGYVSAQLGHANISTTMDIYLHVMKAKRPEAARKTDDLIFGKSSQ